MNELANEIKDLVANNELKAAAEALLHTPLLNEGYLLLRRIKELEDKELKGMITAEELRIERTKIGDSLVKYADRIQGLKILPSATLDQNPLNLNPTESDGPFAEVPIMNFSNNAVSLIELNILCSLCSKADEVGFVEMIDMYEILKHFSRDTISHFLSNSSENMLMFPKEDPGDGMYINFFDKKQAEKIFANEKEQEFEEDEGPKRVVYPISLFQNINLTKNDHLLIAACISYAEKESKNVVNAQMIANLMKDFFSFTKEDFNSSVGRLINQKVISYAETITCFVLKFYSVSL